MNNLMNLMTIPGLDGSRALEEFRQESAKRALAAYQVMKVKTAIQSINRSQGGKMEKTETKIY